jgi:hypothetical protein
MTAISWRQLLEILRAVSSPRKRAHLNPELLRSIPERLGAQTPGNDRDPLDAALQGLASFWRSHYLPQAMNPGFKNDWNIFLALEVGYFYPVRKNKPFPGHPGLIGVLLSDRDHLAVVIADGDSNLAQKYVGNVYGRFWDAIVPQECTLPYSTVRSRIERGLALLASAFNQEETILEAPQLSCEVSKEATAEIPIRIDERPPADRGNLVNSTSSPDLPIGIPAEWKELVNQIVVNPRILLYGGSRVGWKQFLPFVSSELRLKGLVPVFVDLPVYAPYVHEESLFLSCTEIGLPSKGLLDTLVDTELESKCLQANAQGRLVMLADGIDDVPEDILPTILWNLAAVKRLVLPSRTIGPFPPDMVALPMPFLW